MTDAAERGILASMIRAAAVLLLTLLAPAAWASEFDLGFAHPGMTLDEFRAITWPSGMSVRCSGEDDLPPESDNVRLSVPRPVAQLGGTRCGLFSHGDDGWHTQNLDLAGSGAEVWGKFFPDGGGTPRLVQLLIKQPPESFEALADYFTERFGPPELRQQGLARWQGEGAEATIIEDGGKTLLAFVIDTRLQAALNARMSHQPRRAGAKDSH
ncbi:MAG: hypothetical protein NVV74_02500 [Magnetospirillum sp.]|nr:hypothetical protein [Magnetospirillum sp.]